MVYLNGKCTKNCSKNLKIHLTRLPFRDTTNNNKSKMAHKNIQARKKKVIVNIEEPDGKLSRRNNRSPKSPDFEREVCSLSNNKSQNENDHTCGFANTKTLKITLEKINVNYKSKYTEALNRDIESQEQELPLDREQESNLSVRQSIPLKNRLRKCQQTNYLETSLESSAIIANVPSPSSTKPRVPIYKQNVSTDKKEMEDPYELDISDSETKKPKKKKLNTSRKFNKTMYDVLEKLEKKNTKSEKKTSESKALKPTGEYEKNINNAITKVMNRINEKKKSITSQETQPSQIVIGKAANNVNSMFINQDKAKSMNNEFLHDTENPGLAQRMKYIESIHGYENDSGLLGFNTQFNTSKNASTATKMVETPSISRVHVINDILLTNNHFPSGNDDNNDSDSQSNNGYSDEEYFGFSGNDDDDDIINSSNLKSIESPALFSKRRPNANSTMIQKKSKSPWRVTTLLKRKPYLLLVKNSALPNLQQEMVLDHTIVEDIEKHYSKSFLETPSSKPPVQTSMLDYIESSVDHTVEHNSENIVHSSLFDNEEFNVTKPKRSVLRPIQQCIPSHRQDSSTFIPGSHQNVSAIGQRGEESNFNFDEISVNKENYPNSGKPSRLNLAGLKMYKNCVVNNANHESGLLAVGEKESDKDDSMETSIETDAHVQLFDDVDNEFEPEMTIKLPKIKYQRKTRRRRLQSDASDSEEDAKPKKKKKDMMTKAEEAAYEKWAAAFNSMCEEVEQHDLEIE